MNTFWGIKTFPFLFLILVSTGFPALGEAVKNALGDSNPSASLGNGSEITEKYTLNDCSPVLFNKRKQHSYSYTMRSEYFSGNPDNDAGVTAIFSSIRWIDKSIYTLYGYHRTGFPASRTLDSTSAGFNYIVFPAQDFYVSAGGNFTIRGQEDDFSSASITLNKLLGAWKEGRSYWKTSAGYSTFPSFVEFESYNFGVNYYRKINKNGKIDVSFKFVNNSDFSEHVYNKFGVDYTMPLRKKESLTIGYLHIDKLYAAGDGNDDIFRLTYNLAEKGD